VARKTKSVVLSSQSSERGLLNFLLARLHMLDADVIVGHNIAGRVGTLHRVTPQSKHSQLITPSMVNVTPI
jgi:hypothetical protein